MSLGVPTPLHLGGGQHKEQFTIKKKSKWSKNIMPDGNYRVYQFLSVCVMNKTYELCTFVSHWVIKSIFNHYPMKCQGIVLWKGGGGKSMIFGQNIYRFGFPLVTTNVAFLEGSPPWTIKTAPKSIPFWLCIGTLRYWGEKKILYRHIHDDKK